MLRDQSFNYHKNDGIKHARPQNTSANIASHDCAGTSKAVI